MELNSDSAPVTVYSTAEQALKPCFDRYAQKDSNGEELALSLVDICAKEPQATWQALSLLDQYHRRQSLPTALYREVKKALNEIAFGNAGAHVDVSGQTIARAVTYHTAKRTSQHTAQHAVRSSAQNMAPDTAVRGEARTEVHAQPAPVAAANPPDDPATSSLLQPPFEANRTAITASRPQTLVSQTAVPPPMVDLSANTGMFAKVAVDAEPPAAFESQPEPEHPRTLPRLLEPQPLHIQSFNLIRTPVQRSGAVLNDRYMLIEPVASGNISVVFKALDRQRAALPEPERYVAVRCLQDALQQDPRAVAALQHEFQQSQAISHSNIARVFDFSGMPGQCFMVMELLQGEALDRMLERIAPRRLPTARALAITREIGHALAHAHHHGVVHGNLHANNVTITRGGELRVSDFAQSAGWLVADAPQPQPVDDLYSLASIAHELLCGCPPTVRPVPTLRRPAYARHLSTQQWRTLQEGLTEERNAAVDVRRWLQALDLRAAEIRLPELAVVESQVADEGRGKRALWFGGAALAVAALGAIAATLVWKLRSPVPQLAAPEVVAPIAVPAQVETAAPIDTAVVPVVDAAAVNELASDEPMPSAGDLPAVGFAQGRYEVTEQAGEVRLVVQRSEPLNKELQLRWYTAADSAQPGVDYVGYQYASVTLAPGQRRTEILIPLIKQPRRTAPVSFDVRISATAKALPGQNVATKVVLLPGRTVRAPSAVRAP
jgi:hypothetical protein